MSIADGRKIVIEFTQPLTGNVTGLNPPIGSKKSVIDLSKATITTLNQYSSSYPGTKAVDGDVSTYWRGTTAVNWIQAQLLEAKVVTQVKMYLSSYYIKTFTLSGSNDGETWTQIGGTYTAASSSTAQWYTFDIENADAYLYYRVDILTTYSSTVYLYELQLLEDVPVGNETKFTVSFDEYDKVPEGLVLSVTRPVESVAQYMTINEFVNLENGTLSDLTFANGKLELALEGVTS